MVGRKTSLRVLYTINSSPQYILARSHSPVSVTDIPTIEEGSSSGASTKCASVLLKTCLDTICRSSPELTQDTTRDFSIYVLDPLESNSAPAPIQISNGSADATSAPSVEHPRGVAVGLGLMSWAMTSDDRDTVAVVGTLVKQATGLEALEVIFSLRETMSMKQSTWAGPSTASQAPGSSQESAFSYSSSQDMKPLQWRASSQISQQSSNFSRSTSTTDLTRETLASIQMRNKPKLKPPKPVRHSTTPVTESDKLMNADTYIGPVKKKGRPRTANVEQKASTPGQVNAAASGSGTADKEKEKEIIVIDGSDSETGPPVTKTGPKKRIQPPRSSPFTTVPLVRQGTAPQPFIASVQVKPEPKEEPTLLDILAYLSATSSEPNAPNAALLTALNAIDSSDNPNAASADNAPNPVLISALKQLLSACSQPAAPVPPQPSQPPQPAPRHHPSSSISQGDGIVLLDKENVNPVAFKRRAEKPDHKPSDSCSIASSSSRGPSHGSHPERPIQSLGPSTRSNGTKLSKSSLKESSSLPGSDRSVRKRTLSDFMDEKESSRGREKGKERERIDKRDGHRRSSSSVQRKTSDTLRHYPSLLASNAPRIEQPSNYYRTPLESASSPGRPTSESDENDPIAESEPPAPRSPLKQTSPRHHKVSASSPVRGSKHSRRKFIVPAWAVTDTAMQPRLSEEAQRAQRAQRALEEAEEGKKEERNAARRKLFSAQDKLKKKNSTKTLKAKSKPVEEDQPQQRQEFLVPKAPAPSRGPIAASSDGPLIAFPLVSLSSSRPSSPPPNSTVTPRTPKTPSRNRVLSTPDGESLFTPIMRSGSLFGSAYQQRSPQGTPPSILTSPLGNRKKAKISPMCSLLTGKGLPGPANWARMASPKGSPKSSMDSINPEEESKTESSSKEREEGLDNLDCPPSSLPIASSDIDVGTSSYSQPSGEAAKDDEAVMTVKQHWAGLPPSSPLAPSSPMLLPEDSQTDLDEEMDDLPIATSDSEIDADTNAFETHLSSPVGDSPAATFEEQLDFSAFFPMDGQSSDMQEVSSSTMDLFDQFTNVNAQSDDFPAFDAASSMDTDLTDMEAIFQTGLDGMDFSEFWESFKPLITDSTLPTEQGAAGLSNTGDHQLLGSFGDIDHVKLADDMQALLSGCVM